MYVSLSKEMGTLQLPGSSFFIPSLVELKEKYSLQPHVVVQKFGDLVAAGHNTYHVVLCEVLLATFYLTLSGVCCHGLTKYSAPYPGATSNFPE
jgi:hypothetical protein